MLKFKRERAAGLVIGTRAANVTMGHPDQLRPSGRPWRIYPCSRCDRELYTSRTARLAVAAMQLDPVYMCEECAGMPVSRL